MHLEEILESEMRQLADKLGIIDLGNQSYWSFVAILQGNIIRKSVVHNIE